MKYSPVVMLTVLGVVVSAPLAAAQPQMPEPTFDGRNVSFDLAGGSTLRSGDRLTDRLLVTVWQRTTLKGSGTCSANACPVLYNGEEMFARRTRLTVASGGSGESRNSGTAPAGGREGTSSDNRYPAGWRRLQRGDRSDSVKQLQELLVRDGAKLTPDGHFGRSTENAIRDVQRRRGLKVDGIAGYETLRALGV